MRIFAGVRIVPRSVRKGHILSHVDAEGLRDLLLLELLVVEHLHEEEIGHLLKDGYGVGDTTRPEGIPYLVDLILYLSCNHRGQNLETRLLRNLIAFISSSGLGAPRN